MSRGYIDPNFPNPGGPNDAYIIIYGYTPSIVVAVLGVVLFSISSIGHAWQLVKYRSWYFTPLLVGTLMEIIGYAFRLLSSQRDPYNVIYFVVQYFFIVVAPVLFSAAIYTVISVLIQRHPNRSLAPLPPKVILWIFITCDVIATCVQIAGAASIGKAESARKDPTTANNILLAGLASQCFSFAIFIILLGIYLWRLHKAAKAPSSIVATATSTTHGSRNGGGASTNVGNDTEKESAAVGVTAPVLSSGFMIMFVIATMLVYLRTCFRLAETAEGLYENLSTHEVFFGCLEFAPVVVAAFVFNIWHPGRCIQTRN